MASIKKPDHTKYWKGPSRCILAKRCPVRTQGRALSQAKCGLKARESKMIGPRKPGRFSPV